MIYKILLAGLLLTPISGFSAVKGIIGSSTDRGNATVVEMIQNDEAQLVEAYYASQTVDFRGRELRVVKITDSEIKTIDVDSKEVFIFVD